MSNSEKLIGAFSNALGIQREKVNEQLSYQSVKQWDSIAHMVLVAELEDSFNIRIEDKDIMEMDSFLNTRQLLEKYDIQFD